MQSKAGLALLSAGLLLIAYGLLFTSGITSFRVVPLGVLATLAGIILFFSGKSSSGTSWPPGTSERTRRLFATPGEACVALLHTSSELEAKGDVDFMSTATKAHPHAVAKLISKWSATLEMILSGATPVTGFQALYTQLTLFLNLFVAQNGHLLLLRPETKMLLHTLAESLCDSGDGVLVAQGNELKRKLKIGEELCEMTWSSPVSGPLVKILRGESAR